MQLSSLNKRILLFSDMHQDIHRADYILKHEDYDEVVDLGDHFDSFEYDSRPYLERACKFLKKHAFEANYHILHSNHDLHYFYPGPATICSGYTPEKSRLIDQCLGSFKQAIIDRCRWFIFVDDFLCTHAGLHPGHIGPMISLDKESLTSWLRNQCRGADLNLIQGISHWVFRAGAARGGSQKYGGVTWLDFDTEAEPTEGLKQIHGHTPHSSVVPHKLEGSLDPNDWCNIDIDCHLSGYLIIENGKLTVKKFSDL